MGKKQIITAGVVIAIVVVMAVGIVWYPFKKSSSANHTDATPTTTNPSSSTDSTQATQSPPAPATSTPAASTPTPTAAPKQTAAPAPATVYKNGTYTATGSYDSPGGTESITISLTIANDTVTATSATSGANDPTAQRYQNEFIAGYRSQVVGKSLASLQLSKVSGSSLTPHGFNAAVAQIRSQAKA